jgi:MFS transporter, Spinster family, sphingosine-1-phosphate transporter
MSRHDEPATKPRPLHPNVPRYSYYALAVLALVNFLNYIDRQVLPAVSFFILNDPKLKITDAEIGYMESALLLSFTVLAPLFGRLGDRYPRAKLMATAAVLWSFATALAGLADHFYFVPALHVHLPVVNFTLAISGVALALCAVRACVGVGESAYSTITPSLIADYFPPHRRATALGVFQAAIPMGFALGFVIGGVLAKYFGWRVAFMLVGVPGLLTAVLIWRLREPRRGATELQTGGGALEEAAAAPAATAQAFDSDDAGQSTLRTAWRIVTTRDWLFATAGYTALTAALGALATWATVVMARDKGMDPTNADITLGLITLLGGAAGTFGGGWVADRIAARWHNAYFLVCAVSTLVAVLPTLAVLIADDPRVYLPCIFVSVALLFVSNAPVNAILLESVPARTRAMAVALNIVFIHVCGDAISRPLVGVLSEALKQGHLAALSSFAEAIGIEASRQQLSTALLFSPAAVVVSTVFFFLGARLQKK